MIDCANFPWESVSTTSRFSEEARLHLVSCNRCYQRLQVLLALEKFVRVLSGFLCGGPELSLSPPALCWWSRWQG